MVVSHFLVAVVAVVVTRCCRLLVLRCCYSSLAATLLLLQHFTSFYIFPYFISFLCMSKLVPMFTAIQFTRFISFYLRIDIDKDMHGQQKV